MRSDCDARTSSAVLSTSIGSRRELPGWGSRHPHAAEEGDLSRRRATRSKECVSLRQAAMRSAAEHRVAR
jgi:hypothetical protein